MPAAQAAMTPADLSAAPRLLTTPRLRVEAAALQHAAAFAAGVRATLPALDFVGWSRHPDEHWAERFCADDARCFDAGEDLAFHVFTHEDRQWVGRIDVHSIHFSVPRGEIGYVGNLHLAGQGLMREAALAVIDLCFGLGFARIEALSDARNLRALHFAQTLGMQREGLLRSHDRDRHGALYDEVVFAIVNDPAAAAAPLPKA
jgi:RimJ/RimL family protein N-acetyltransferase